MNRTIRAKDLSLYYGKDRVLQEINFSVEEGKIIGLLGRNGAGKTSLLSLLANFRKATEGEILVGNETPFENARLMEEIVFIRDTKNEEETTKVGKWIRLVARFRPRFDHDYAAALVRKFQIPLDRSVKNLSKGMQSALSVTIGLASRAPITIFDEAYLGMDAPAREKFYEEILNDYMAHPRTIILSTHLISEMDSLFEEVIILKKGSLLLHEKTEDLLAKGITVTGDKEAVDQWMTGKSILKERVLGNSKAVTIYGSITSQEQEKAQLMGLQLAPVTLQEMFIHLTEEEGI